MKAYSTTLILANVLIPATCGSSSVTQSPPDVEVPTGLDIAPTLQRVGPRNVNFVTQDGVTLQKYDD